jgi:hypothetical protein
LAVNSKHNPKSVYSYINNKTSIKESIKAIKMNNGVISTNSLEIADTLNEFFASVFIKDGSTVEDLNEECATKCPNPSFNTSIIQKHLNNLNTQKSVGPDKVHPKVLKECAKSLSLPLSLIFEKSFLTGSIPKLWSCANVIPLFKKGNKLDPTNYRPVSLTSIVCKIMERIIRDQMMVYLVENNLISKEQHGFVNNKSCITNLLETWDLITKAFGEDYSIDVLFLDFAKAFDSVSHVKLLKKLLGLGFVSFMLNWCKAFLSNRTQRVVIGENISSWKKVTSGVPQGSVLGPLLFVIFINDLSKRIIKDTKLYADDTKVISINRCQDDSKLLQEDINTLVKWSEEWMIKFNESKCKVMYFGKQNPKHEYIMNNTILSETTIEKDLGIYISNNLEWGHHINTAVGKANKKLGLIKNSFEYLDETTLKLLYKSLVRPHLEYGASIWSPQWKKDILKLESVQRRATKIESLRGKTYDERLSILDLPSLEVRRRRGDLIQMYKIAKGKDIVNFHYPPKRFEHKQASRRNNFRIRRQLTNSRIRHHFFTNRVSIDWNCLSQEIIDVDNINIFKNSIDKLFNF